MAFARPWFADDDRVVAGAFAKRPGGRALAMVGQLGRDLAMEGAGGFAGFRRPVALTTRARR